MFIQIVPTMRASRIYVVIILLLTLICSNCKKDKLNEISKPSAPSALQANAFSSSQINLAWTDNADNETGFKVERSIDNSTWTEIVSLGSNVTTHQNTGLNSATKYYYRVRAYNKVGNSNYSATANATTLSVGPTLTTASVTNITNTTATGGGNITGDGGNAVTERGVCWSTSVNPTTADNKTSDGAGTGSFTSSITGLSSGTLYYVRAYATNSSGTGYGDQVNFTTLTTAVLPTLTTTAATNITMTTATSGGNISSDGGASVTARGVCWSTSQNPTTANSKTTDASGTGSFTSSITGLTLGTTYYVRAYATNSVGTAYGTQVSFATITNPVLATLTTTGATNIAITTASSGGNITSDGGAAVTVRGVCWSTSQNPTTANSKTTDGSGTGIFTSSITGLTAGTTYYVRAYATNSVGTAYGTQVSFATLTSAVLATLTTTAATNIATTTATSGGNITSDGGAAVTVRGVCWSTSQNPTTANSKTTDGSGTGSFPSSITSLTPGTTYYVRAYATNSVGTAYGTQVSFATLTSAVLATLTTTAATNIAATTATSGGNITSDGGAAVTVRGVCWSTSQNPTTANSKTTDGSGTGAFSSNITGLTASTPYYVRAYATNSVGTAYGLQTNFTTLAAANSPVLTGPSQATGSFNLSWTFNWPGLVSTDDHYELEWSYNQTSGYQILATYPFGVRTSPYTDIITPEAVDIGKTTYFRVRAKSNGSYSAYSNIISVYIPYININVNPDYDNAMLYASNVPSYASTVYNNSDLAAGTNYIYGAFVNDYLLSFSALHFNINNLISGKTIQKATLYLYVKTYAADFNTNYVINALAGSWNTNTITYNNIPNHYTSPSIIQSPPGTTVWQVDITSIVQFWANNPASNFGILISDNNIAWPGYTAFRETYFYSLETAISSSYKPKLYIEIR
jgi:hypothetical protein